MGCGQQQVGRAGVGSTARQLLAAWPPSSWQLRAPGPAVCHLLRPSQRASRAAAGGPARRTSGGPVLAGRWVPGQGRGGEAEGAVSLWAAGHGRSLQGTLRGTLEQCLYPGWTGSPSVRLLVSCRPPAQSYVLFKNSPVDSMTSACGHLSHGPHLTLCPCAPAGPTSQGVLMTAFLCPPAPTRPTAPAAQPVGSLLVFQPSLRSG